MNNQIIDIVAKARIASGVNRYSEARKLYKKALLKNPTDFDLLTEFAIFEVEAGKFSSAKKLFKKAVTIKPDDIDTHVNLAEIARQSGDIDSAVQHFSEAIELDSEALDINFGLGEALYLVGEFTQALPYLYKASSKSPSDPEILLTLANCLSIQEERNCSFDIETLKIYEKVVKIVPQYFEAWCCFASSLFNHELYIEANKAFANAANIKPIPDNLLVRASRSALHCGDTQLSLRLAEKAISRNSNVYQAYFIKGVIKQSNGDFDGAEEYFRKTIDGIKDSGEAYEKLANIQKLKLDEKGDIEKIIANENLPPNMRSSAGFALYHLLKKHDTAAAFTVLEKANEFKSRLNKFDYLAHSNLVDDLISTFNKEFFIHSSSQGLKTDLPIFILGMPRSGTTLTEQILAAHPDVYPGGERSDFQDLIATISDYPKNIGNLSADWAMKKGKEITTEMSKSANGAQYVTNKMPGNYICVGLIRLVFPDAKIIYCRRDPRDIGLSSFEQNFRQGLSFTYNLQDFALAYRQHEKIMQHWQSECAIPMTTVDYENLVTNYDEVARDILSYCGLNWVDSCLEPEKVAREVDTASFWQVRQPVNSNSVGKWKKFAEYLKPMLDILDS